MQNSHLRKLLVSLLLTCILTLTALPACADSSFKAVVSEDGMEVFTVDAPHAMMGTLSKGTIVTVEAVKGKAALISSGDRQGVCPVASLRKLDSGDDSTATDVVTTRKTRIYRKADATGRYVTVKAGTKLKLLSVDGDCAMVSRDGLVGYARAGHLGNPGDAPRTMPSVSYSGSNEEIIIQFLMNELGYNRAAACGVAANIKYESGYQPTQGGDGGSSYGIVQWHAARKTNLINWCAAIGLDHATLKGQLYFLKYELTNDYASVHEHLLGVEDSPEGAYDAGHYFCYYFEAPSGKTSKSQTRGEYAKSTLYARYA